MWLRYHRGAGFGALGKRVVLDGSRLPAWSIVGCGGRTIHPASAKRNSQEPLDPELPSVSRKEVRALEGACLRTDPRAWELALRPGTSGDPAPAHLPPSATAVGGQSCRQSGQRQQHGSGNPTRQQRPVPHGLPGLARLCCSWAALAAARDGGTGCGGGGSDESPQSGSSSPGGGRWAAWLALPAGGLRQPRRAAPPLILAALAGVVIGYPAGPHCGTRAHRSGAQTMGSERGRGSRPSEPNADGLAVGAHPRPLPGGSRLRACTGRRPLP